LEVLRSEFLRFRSDADVREVKREAARRREDGGGAVFVEKKI
jgi:hypothetical protein